MSGRAESRRRAKQRKQLVKYEQAMFEKRLPAMEMLLDATWDGYMFKKVRREEDRYEDFKYTFFDYFDKNGNPVDSHGNLLSTENKYDPT